jgi:hypothetical protein
MKQNYHKIYFVASVKQDVSEKIWVFKGKRSILEEHIILVSKNCFGDGQITPFASFRLFRWPISFLYQSVSEKCRDLSVFCKIPTMFAVRLTGRHKARPLLFLNMLFLLMM